MILRLAATTFILGSALGVGAMYMSEQWRNARAAARAELPAEPEQLSQPFVQTPLVSRDIIATDIDALPSDLALDEIYDRVSHA